LMDIEFNKQEVIRLTDKVWACLVWNEKLNLAPVNDRIIKVSSPLGMEPYARMISSIMAKNYAMWINHCLIDIPMGPTAKVATMKDAKRVAKRFKEIWEYLWIKMDVQVTDGSQPIGRWIWACLQAREALRILQQYKIKSEDLEKKAIFLASKILVLCWKVSTINSAKKLVNTQLTNWEAWKKMQEIIKAQNWNPHIESEEIQLGKFSHDVVAEKDCVITKVDMRHLNTMVRWLWAPKEYQAGIYLHKKLWDKIKKWEVIYTMYSPSANKLNLVKDMQQQKDFYTYRYYTPIKDKINNVVKKLT
jgi:thymidine phosphorylase